MSDQEIRYLGEVQRLEMKPGDVLVLKVDNFLTVDAKSHIRDVLKAAIGETGAKALILERGMEIGVLGSPDKAA